MGRRPTHIFMRTGLLRGAGHLLWVLMLTALPAWAQNAPPVVSLTPSYVTTRVNRSVTLRATTSDPDGDFVTFRWEKVSGPEGELSTTTALVTTYTQWMAGPHELRFTAEDGRGGVTTETAWVIAARRGVLGDAIITTIAGTGVSGLSGDGGPATSATLSEPEGLAVDPTSGDLYFTSRSDRRIRRIDGGTGIISAFAGNGDPCCGEDGTAALEAGIGLPQYVNVGRPDRVHISVQHTVLEIDPGDPVIRSVAGTGAAAGFWGDGGPATSAGLNVPAQSAVSQNGDLWIADLFNHRIRRVDAVTGTISTVLGREEGFAARGAARLEFPSAPVFDTLGNWYFAESRAGRIWRVDAESGLMTSVAGRLNNPMGLLLDGDDLYFCNHGAHWVGVIHLSTGTLDVLAGTGVPGSSGDGGPATAAQLNFPASLVLDNSRNLYVTDFQNHRVRVISLASGIITSFAGTGESGSTGDGGLASEATISRPAVLAWTPNGALLVSEFGGHRIRQIDTSTGIITTIAGTGTEGSGGDGGPASEATLSKPDGLAVDSAGNVYVVLFGAHTVRRIDAETGTISTVAGTGTFGFSPDGTLATSASLEEPWKVTFDPGGALLITERGGGAYSPDRSEHGASLHSCGPDQHGQCKPGQPDQSTRPGVRRGRESLLHGVFWPSDPAVGPRFGGALRGCGDRQGRIQR